MMQKRIHHKMCVFSDQVMFEMELTLVNIFVKENFQG